MAGEGICQAGEDTTLASKDGNKANQACNRGDIEVAREGEETSPLDLKSWGDDMENQAGNQGDIKVTREGEKTSLLDLKSRGDDRKNQASNRGNTEARKGEDNPELDLGIRRNVEATREGEDTPKPKLGNQEEIEATRCITPVTTKEE